MTSNLHIAWLTGGSGPLSEATLQANPYASLAGARWQTGLITGLMTLGCRVTVLGHVAEPLWPKGRLRFDSRQTELAAGFSGTVVNYWNVPYLRTTSLVYSYRAVLDRLCQTDRPDVLLSYNMLDFNYQTGVFAQLQHGIPWISINADHWSHRGSSKRLHANVLTAADGVVYLPWGNFARATGPALHLDGGVEDLQFDDDMPAVSDRKIVLYTGGLHPAKGTLLLAEAFRQVTKHTDAKLWYCGQGQNDELFAIAQANPRIKLLGRLSEDELAAVSQQATVFVNPRIPGVLGNDENFPSKVLEYLRYGKPVISTWTDGLAPEYRNVLVLAEPESTSFAVAIDKVLSWDAEQYRQHRQSIHELMVTRLWTAQARRLIDWLYTDILHAVP